MMAPIIPSGMYPPLPIADLDHVFNHTGELWERLREKRIFITGGTGFVGIWLLESFLHASEKLGLNAEALVLSRNPERFLKQLPHLANRRELQFVAGDIRDFTFPDGSFSHTIHAAADVKGRCGGAFQEEVFDIITTGTQHLLSFLAQARPEQLLFVSSGAVYGPQPSHVPQIGESHHGAPDPLLPSSAYGLGKLAAEHLCAVHAARNRYEVKIARCFAFVGPHLPLNGGLAIGNFIRDGLQGGPICLLSDGKGVRSYLYAADLAIWLWKILFSGQSGRAYNVGSSSAISIGSLGRKIAKICGVPAPVAVCGLPLTLPSTYVPNVERAETELGLKEQISLDEALSRTLGWHRSRHS